MRAAFVVRPPLPAPPELGPIPHKTRLIELSGLDLTELVQKPKILPAVLRQGRGIAHQLRRGELAVVAPEHAHAPPAAHLHDRGLRLHRAQGVAARTARSLRSPASDDERLKRFEP